MRVGHLILHGAIARLVGAIDYTQCLQEVRNGSFGLQGALDNHGNPVVDLKSATAISYNLCLSACGKGTSAFSWSIFSQRAASWLIPWLALACQLPYGAEDHFDNLQSMLLCLGSPTLAAYSLALTALNKRWITGRFSPMYEHHHTHTIVHVLDRLQQSHLQLTDRAHLLPLLFNAENKKWWREIKMCMNLTHSWSAPTVASIGWVLVAYVFTVFDAFTAEVGLGANNLLGGIAVGALCIWLLPIVVGWLQISPVCDRRHLESAINRANKLVFATRGEPANELVTGPISLLRWTTTLRGDQNRSPPIFNYSRVFHWSEVVETIAESLAISAQTSSEEWLGSSSTQPLQKGNFNILHVWERMFVSGCLAIWLQWGTTSGAIISAWFSPTTGLSCRASAYLAYGALSTLSWLLMVLSSILAHHIAACSSRSLGRKTRILEHLGIFLRRLGKIIASLNAIGIVAVCIFHFSSIFSNCYCRSSVIWWGSERAYNVIELHNDDVVGMKNAWIVGEILAGSSAIGFLLFVNLFANTPFPRLDIED